MKHIAGMCQDCGVRLYEGRCELCGKEYPCICDGIIPRPNCPAHGDCKTEAFSAKEKP